MLTTSLFEACRMSHISHCKLSPPSVPSFQSLPEEVLSKLADVLEEVMIPKHFFYYKHLLTNMLHSICSCHLFI